MEALKAQAVAAQPGAHRRIRDDRILSIPVRRRISVGAGLDFWDEFLKTHGTAAGRNFQRKIARASNDGRGRLSHDEPS